MNPATYQILPVAGWDTLLQPRAARPVTGCWYVGVNADGSHGVLAQWNGFNFESSLSDDHDMTRYAYLREQPHRG